MEEDKDWEQIFGAGNQVAIGEWKPNFQVEECSVLVHKPQTTTDRAMRPEPKEGRRWSEH